MYTRTPYDPLLMQKHTINVRCAGIVPTKRSTSWVTSPHNPRRRFAPLPIIRYTTIVCRTIGARDIPPHYTCIYIRVYRLNGSQFCTSARLNQDIVPFNRSAWISSFFIYISGHIIWQCVLFGADDFDGFEPKIRRADVTYGDTNRPSIALNIVYYRCGLCVNYRFWCLPSKAKSYRKTIYDGNEWY